ncbi:MAG TPA: SgcJ/EcaC family oxidoreductase [Gemmatimonadaceae bacterium]
MKWSAGSWLLVPLLIAGCQQRVATTTTLADEDLAAVEQLFASVADAIRGQDWDAFLATFADDAVFHPVDSPALEGKAAIEEWVRAGPAAEPEFAFTDVQVFGEGNLAYGTSNIHLALEGMPAQSGKQLVVLRKDGTGSWKTVAVSYNLDAPMQPDTAAPVQVDTTTVP